MHYTDHIFLKFAFISIYINVRKTRFTKIRYKQHHPSNIQIFLTKNKQSYMEL